ncbi:hypothetical protein ACH41H_18505 [Streptomyces sp. NPDC020800]|uniref:hypothetical protein n=1 Tax=Streptomyces sp. NPDC020800 TaxID=3365092 RepID=UPI0037B014D1
MDAEIVQLAEMAGPYLTAAAGAYGAAVLSRAEDAAADATVNVGRRILQAVWRRRDEAGQAALEAAVTDVGDDPEDSDAAATLRQQIKRALRDDAELRVQLAALLPTPTPGAVTINSTGDRNNVAHTIGTAISGDITPSRP